MPKYRIMKQVKYDFEWYHLEWEQYFFSDWKYLTSGTLDMCKKALKNHKEHGSINDCAYSE